MDFSNVSQLFVGGKEVDELYIGGKLAWSSYFEERPYFYMEPLTSQGCKIYMTTSGTPTAAVQPQLEYSFNQKQWTAYNRSQLVIPAGTKAYFRNRSSQSAFASAAANYWKFMGTYGSIKVGGYINSLLDKDNFETMTTLGDFALISLFRQNTYITDASDLKLTATTLGNRSYASMFRDCTGLVHGPSTWTPPEHIGQNGCSWMFQNCTAMEDAFGDFICSDTGIFCYRSMFQGCAKYNATVVFHGLPTNSNSSQYEEMFSGCSQLDNFSVKDWTRGWAYGTNNWMYGVSATGTAYLANISYGEGPSGVPSGWTVVRT